MDMLNVNIRHASDGKELVSAKTVRDALGLVVQEEVVTHHLLTLVEDGSRGLGDFDCHLLEVGALGQLEERPVRLRTAPVNLNLAQVVKQVAVGVQLAKKLAAAGKVLSLFAVVNLIELVSQGCS